MIARFVREDDYVGPEDLAMLPMVFDEECGVRDLQMSSAETDGLARYLIEMFKVGARDRASLRRLLGSPEHGGPVRGLLHRPELYRRKDHC